MTITNPPSASSQIELGKSHYLIRSLYQAPSLGGELAFGLKYASIDKDVLLCGHTYEHVTSVHRSYTSSLIWIECIEKKHMEHHLITHISTLTSKPNLSYIKVCRAPPPCLKPAGERLRVLLCVCARISQSSSVTVPSRWPTVIRWSDFIGPSVELPSL